MPVSKINYTGRARIKRDEARIYLHKLEGQLPFFDASLCFDKHQLPSDALVFVDAYRQAYRSVFPFGTVGHISPPAQEDRCLSAEMDPPDGVLFRVRVTDMHNCRILAEGNRLSPVYPDEPAHAQSLLPVVPADISEAWKLDFSDEPLLLINQSIGDWKAAVKLPGFISLAMPAVLREILTRALLIEKVENPEDSEDWRGMWLKLASLLPGMNSPPQIEEEMEDGIDWINEAVAAFCSKHRIPEHFLNYKDREEQ